MSDENVDDIIASIDVPDPVEDALEAYRVECVRSSSTYRQRGKAADALRDAVRRSIYEAEKRGEEDARASRPREAAGAPEACPCCGGTDRALRYSDYDCVMGNKATLYAKQQDCGGDLYRCDHTFHTTPASAPAEGGGDALVDAVERVLLTAEPVTERQGDEEVVVGYRHKTGAIHALLTAVRERGSSVSMPRPATPASATAEGGGEAAEAQEAYAKTFGEILARDICESEPSGAVIEAQDRLQGTDAATFLVIAPKDLASWARRAVSNAFYDGEIRLPATPASAAGREGAVEKARQAFYEAARGMFTHGSAWGGTHWTIARDAYDALLAAEAEGGGE